VAPPLLLYLPPRPGNPVWSCTASDRVPGPVVWSGIAHELPQFPLTNWPFWMIADANVSV